MNIYHACRISGITFIGYRPYKTVSENPPASNHSDGARTSGLHNGIHQLLPRPCSSFVHTEMPNNWRPLSCKQVRVLQTCLADMWRASLELGHLEHSHGSLRQRRIAYISLISLIAPGVTGFTESFGERPFQMMVLLSLTAWSVAETSP